MSDKPIVEKSFNEELDVEKMVKEGGVLARLFLEVQGNDKDAAQEALESTVFKQMAAETQVKLLEAKMFDILPDEEKKESFSGVVEVKVVAVDFRWFVNYIMRYGPSAVEIMQPEEVTLKGDEMHSLVSDVSEIVQTYSTRILSMLKDDEGRELYNKLVKGEG